MESENPAVQVVGIDPLAGVVFPVIWSGGKKFTFPEIEAKYINLY